MSDQTEAHDTLDAGRKMARRRMAWYSFIFMIAFGCLLAYGLVLSPARESVATAVSTASGPLIGLMTVFTTIVCAYLGVSVAEKIFKKQ